MSDFVLVEIDDGLWVRPDQVIAMREVEYQYHGGQTQTTVYCTDDVQLITKRKASAIVEALRQWVETA